MPRKRAEEEETAKKVFTVNHDKVVEQILIAAALVDREARKRLCKVLPTSDKFHTPQFAAAWRYVLELEKRSLDHDPLLMSRMVGERVDAGYLAKLLDANPEAPKNLDSYVAALLHDDVRVRCAKGPGSQFIEALGDPAHPPERLRVLARNVAAMFDGGSGAGRYLVNTEELVRRQMADMAERIEGRTNFPFGIPALDYYEDGYESKGEQLGGQARMTPGAMPKLITLLAADTGVGKSLLAAHVALGQAKRRKKVLYCAWEPDEGMTLELIACIHLGWSRKALIQGRSQDSMSEPMRPDERALIEEKMHGIGKYVEFMSNPFHGDTKQTNQAHLDILQEHVESSGADFVVCDLLERMFVENQFGDESQALRRLQQMAKQTIAHYLWLAQFNKSEASEGIPTRRSITGSKSWSQIPNNIICPFRPGLLKNVEDNTMELYILKQRDGLYPQVVEFDYDGDRGAFANGRTIPYVPPTREEGGGVGELFGKKAKSKKDRD